jgi:hypothetical protein
MLKKKLKPQTKNQYLIAETNEKKKEKVVCD